jgi:hypothetical protein
MSTICKSYGTKEDGPGCLAYCITESLPPPAMSLVVAQGLVIPFAELHGSSGETTQSVLERLLTTHKIPTTSRFALWHHIRLAKAFNSFPHRIQMIKAHIQGLCVAHQHQQHDITLPSSSVFELIDLVTAVDTVPEDVQTIAVQALEAYTRDKHRAPNLVSLLGVNTSNGPVPFLLRRVVASLSHAISSAVSMTYAKSVLELVLVVIAWVPGVSSFVSSSLFVSLLQLLSHHKHGNYACNLVALRIMEVVFESFNSAVTAYREINGFDMLCGRLEFELDCWLNNPSSSSSSSLSLPVVVTSDNMSVDSTPKLFTLPDFERIGRLRLIEGLVRVLHLTLTVNIRQSRLRSIIDGKLPVLLKSMLENSQLAGPSIWTRCCALLCEIINADPMIFPELTDKGLPQMLLTSLELYSPLLENVEVALSVTNIISAISLNLDQGLPLVKDLKPVKLVLNLYTKFDNPAAQRMVSVDFSLSLGSALEELYRHVPSLRETGIALAVDTFREIIDSIKTLDDSAMDTDEGASSSSVPSEQPAVPRAASEKVSTRLDVLRSFLCLLQQLCQRSQDNIANFAEKGVIDLLLSIPQIVPTSVPLTKHSSFGSLVRLISQFMENSRDRSVIDKILDHTVAITTPWTNAAACAHSLVSSETPASKETIVRVRQATFVANILNCVLKPIPAARGADISRAGMRDVLLNLCEMEAWLLLELSNTSFEVMSSVVPDKSENDRAASADKSGSSMTDTVVEGNAQSTASNAPTLNATGNSLSAPNSAAFTAQFVSRMTSVLRGLAPSPATTQLQQLCHRTHFDELVNCVVGIQTLLGSLSRALTAVGLTAARASLRRFLPTSDCELLMPVMVSFVSSLEPPSNAVVPPVRAVYICAVIGQLHSKLLDDRMEFLQHPALLQALLGNNTIQKLLEIWDWALTERAQCLEQNPSLIPFEALLALLSRFFDSLLSPTLAVNSKSVLRRSGSSPNDVDAVINAFHARCREALPTMVKKWVVENPDGSLSVNDSHAGGLFVALSHLVSFAITKTQEANGSAAVSALE